MHKTFQGKSIFSIFVTIGLWCITVIYIIAFSKIIIFKCGFTSDFRSLSLIPFRFIGDFCSPTTSIDVLLKNTLGNLAIFIPMGILLPTLLKEWTAKKTIFTCFIVSLVIEILQYITGIGMTDIDDLILNTAGASIGAFLYFNGLIKIDNKVKSRLATFTFLCIFGFCGVLSLWLYQPNILPPQNEVINQEVLGELSPDSFHVEAVCTSVVDNTLVTYKPIFHKKTNIETKEGFQCTVDNDTQFFTKLLGVQYSPNGNVQKTISTYGKISKQEFDALIKEKKTTVELKVSDGNKCSAVLVWLWENEDQ